MKIIGLVCLLFALYQTVTGKAIQVNTTGLEAEEELCVNELHLNKNEIEIINNVDIVPEDDVNFNKFLSCYWKKMDWVNDDGTIKYEKVQEALTNAALSEIESEDSQIKLMVQLLLQTTILECKNKLSGSTITIAKFQNCIIREMEQLIA